MKRLIPIQRTNIRRRTFVGLNGSQRTIFLIPWEYQSESEFNYKLFISKTYIQCLVYGGKRLDLQSSPLFLLYLFIHLAQTHLNCLT